MFLPKFFFKVFMVKTVISLIWVEKVLNLQIERANFRFLAAAWSTYLVQPPARIQALLMFLPKVFWFCVKKCISLIWVKKVFEPTDWMSQFPLFKWRLGQRIRFNLRLEPENNSCFCPRFILFFVKKFISLIWIEVVFIPADWKSLFPLLAVAWTIFSLYM